MSPRRADAASDRLTGILLVHGAWHGPWCWDGFRARLAAGGREVRAVRLRGHEGRPGRIWHRLSAYVDDVARAAAAFPEPPALVGHSLGGLVVQKYLEGVRAPAAVLMASVPTGGTAALTLRVMRRHPGRFLRSSLTMSLLPLVATPDLARRWFFTEATPQEVVDACHARLQDESLPAYLESMVLRLPRPRRVTTPILVLGAAKDTVFTVDEVRRTARAYGTEAEVFPGMGHDMMLDTGWEAVADRVAAWVDATARSGRAAGVRRP